MWLTDQPEILSTINFIPAQTFRGFSLTVIIGASTLAVFFILRRKIRTHVSWAAAVIAMAWLPLYANLIYNASYDLIENSDYNRLNLEKRRILRLCNMDHRQGLGNSFCQLYSFFSYAKSLLPQNSVVSLAVDPGVSPFFTYYLYPHLTIGNVAEADYLLFYYPIDYRYENGILYKRSGSVETREELKIGEYVVRGAMGRAKLILEKIQP